MDYKVSALVAKVSLLDCQQVLVLKIDAQPLSEHRESLLPVVDAGSLPGLVKELQLHLETVTQALAKALPELRADARLNANLLQLALERVVGGCLVAA